MLRSVLTDAELPDYPDFRDDGMGHAGSICNRLVADAGLWEFQDVAPCGTGVNDPIPVAILPRNFSLCFVARVCRATEHALTPAMYFSRVPCGLVAERSAAVRRLSRFIGGAFLACAIVFVLWAGLN